MQAIFDFYESYLPTSADEARSGLFKICELLRYIPIPSSRPHCLASQSDNIHAALHDILILKASTQNFFVDRRYDPVVSPPVDLSDIISCVIQSQGGTLYLSFQDANGSSASKRKRSQSPECKKYRSEFIWGQLIGWFKQTVDDPATSLQSDRRGCIQLPDVENCYSERVLDGNYLSEQRPKMMQWMECKMGSAWPKGMIWRFKREGRVFGSPALDVAIDKRHRGRRREERFGGMLRVLKTTFQNDVTGG